ncbi:hypothetical protein [Actinoplanes sp. TFC3]|uniref:hypothetical protein n=1 Tax=Actinoplanes sp. TFC3 TaxID=1710355 RepID=UPI000AEEA57F|nr:hypothetical protein [Actinoplanes sp. TFC3]
MSDQHSNVLEKDAGNPLPHRIVSLKNDEPENPVTGLRDLKNRTGSHRHHNTE